MRIFIVDLEKHVALLYYICHYELIPVGGYQFRCSATFVLVPYTLNRLGT